jgi:ankyrin repeat protein
MHTVATQGYDNLVDILHKAGAPLDSQTSKGITPLLMAVIMDFEKLVQFFLDQGKNLSSFD